jgi:cytoskeletal protein RodZ
MSLINDALKRAKQAQQNNPPLPESGLQLRPVEPRQRPSAGPAILLGTALVVVAMLAGFFSWQARQNRRVTQQIANVKNGETPTAKSALPTPSPSQAAAPQSQLAVAAAPPTPDPTALAAAEKPSKETAAPTSASPAAAQSATAPTASAVAPEAPPKPSPPRLQGILYRPSRTSAVIDGKAVSVGDSVGEFRVSAITRQSVTLVSASQTNVMNLPE